MAQDIFDKLNKNRGPIGQYAKGVHGYFTFPKLEGELGNKMYFRGKEVLTWSINNYLGLANHPEVRKADADAAAEWGMAYPMGARMMTGQTKYHEQLEQEIAEFMGYEDSIVVNFGYQGMVSTIDCLVDRHDVIVYDSESHACILDGMRLHVGKRFVFQHNDMESFDKQMARATKVAEANGGASWLLLKVFSEWPVTKEKSKKSLNSASQENTTSACLWMMLTDSALLERQVAVLVKHKV